MVGKGLVERKEVTCRKASTQECSMSRSISSQSLCMHASSVRRNIPLGQKGCFNFYIELDTLLGLSLLYFVADVKSKYHQSKGNSAP